ncbi:MAG: KUP/HAK/KT family potassium transporter, partial [Kofleriaceae bacterium]
MHGHAPHGKKQISAVSLGALGAVYGDIGTSPLYAMSECLSATKARSIRPGLDGMYQTSQVLGVLSLFFWALMLVVVLKYLVFVLRADNKGEGGILALAALVQQSDKTQRRTRLAVPILLALFGAGLLYGDGIITPAISVLGAVEGVRELNPAFHELVVPVSAAILIGLFWVQKVGTH